MMRIHLKVDHKRLKAARGKVRPSDVARDLNVTPQAFASYERGTNRVPADVLVNWCKLVELTPAEVISSEDRRTLQALTGVKL